MRTWSYTGLLVAILVKWLGEKVMAEDIVQLCADNFPACEDILNGEENIDKRFLRFGRALSGDEFFRFGKGGQQGFLRIGRSDNVYPIEDKRFLRFGRGSVSNVDDALTYLTAKIRNFELKNGIKLRRKRSADAENEAAAESTNLVAASEQGNPSSVEKRDAPLEEETADKRFMRFGKSDPDAMMEEADKRFMRFGRDPDKRFMRFGRGGSEDENMDKRFMRFGRNGEDKRFMRFGRDPEAEKRFMRFGRDPLAEKRFMRFGRGSEDEDELEGLDEEDVDNVKRFMRFGRDPDKRFMRFGKRFMRFGRGDAEDEENTADKRFMRFGRAGADDDTSADKRFMRFGRDSVETADKRFMRFGRDPNTEADKRFMRFGK